MGICKLHLWRNALLNNNCLRNGIMDAGLLLTYLHHFLFVYLGWWSSWPWVLVRDLRYAWWGPGTLRCLLRWRSCLGGQWIHQILERKMKNIEHGQVKIDLRDIFEVLFLCKFLFYIIIETVTSVIITINIIETVIIHQHQSLSSSSTQLSLSSPLSSSLSLSLQLSFYDHYVHLIHHRTSFLSLKSLDKKKYSEQWPGSKQIYWGYQCRDSASSMLACGFGKRYGIQEKFHVKSYSLNI